MGLRLVIRLLRSVLTIEGVVHSFATLQKTRRLEERLAVGDPRASTAIGLTSEGYMLGIPNAMIATAYFVMVAVLSITGLADRGITRRLTLISSWISLATSGYLLYSLFFVLKRRCPICMQAHLLNLATTLALTLRVDSLEPKRQ